VIGLTVLAVLHSIPWFITLNVMYKNFYEDDKKTNLVYWLWVLNIIDTTVKFILPTTTIVIFNTLIVYNTRKQNHIQKNMISSFAATNEITRNSNDKMSNIKVTKMLVIISSIFICLNAPL